MRRSLLVLAILVSVIFIGTTGASSASAATNCTMAETGLQWVGYLSFGGYAYGCTVDTDKVEFAGTSASGLWDATWSGYVLTTQAPTPHVEYIELVSERDGAIAARWHGQSDRALLQSNT